MTTTERINLFRHKMPFVQEDIIDRLDTEFLSAFYAKSLALLFPIFHIANKYNCHSFVASRTHYHTLFLTGIPLRFLSDF